MSLALFYVSMHARKWQPTPVFLPGELNGERSLVGYSRTHEKRVLMGGHQEWDTTEWLTHMHAKLLQSCLTLCDPMDYSLPGSSVHGILQARILEWVAMSFSRGSLQPRNRTQVSLLPEPRGQGKMYGKMSMYGKMQKSGFIKTVPLMCTLSRYVGPVFCFPPSWIASGCVVQSGFND